MSKKDKYKNNIHPNYNEESLKRKHRFTIHLNDHEVEAFKLYCKKYKVKNKSAFVRESMMRSVMGRFLEDYPTLFGKQELDRLVVIEHPLTNKDE